MSQKHLGEFELLVAAAVLRLGDAAYGTAIRNEIERRANRTVTVGALYATLARMEEKAVLSARTGEATPTRGGRAKRYFRLTPTGHALLERSVAALTRMLEGVAL
ncbi:MAG: helix-turn-helix transcriptional regulator [Pseudomonadota bacterium]